jgi:hypothetical protein
MSALTLIWKRGEPFLNAFNGDADQNTDPSTAVFSAPVFNIVRNEIDPNNVRPLHEPGQVVTTEPEGQTTADPFMPRYFPSGVWNLYQILAHDVNEPYLYPFFISTDAEQLVETWALDERGGYDHPTGQQVMDTGYGLHNSSSHTTLGCLRVGPVSDSTYIRQLVALVRPAIAPGGGGAVIKVYD